ncbi:MAG: hypothetical protein H6740_14300 [Alphaproteobacteria bacterium]|nr:hypothetical protein [Alphaproteobacteria bacterium]
MSRITCIALGLTLLASSAAAEEPCPASVEALEAELAASQRAFSELDAEGFQAARLRSEQALGCLEGTLTPRLSAEVHLVMALGSFWDQDEAATLASMQALLALKPHYSFGPPLVPSGDHPLGELLAQAEAMDEGLPQAVTAPHGTMVRIDGSRTDERFPQRAAVAQVITESGELLWTGYVLPGDPLPPSGLPAVPKAPRQRLARGLLVGGASFAAGGSAAVIAGLAYRYEANTLGTRIAAVDDTLTAEEGERFFTTVRRANTLGYAGQAGLLAGAALAGVGVALSL